MCRLFETIKIEDGKVFNLDYHQQRVDRSFDRFFPLKQKINLHKTISQIELPDNGLFRCRVDYSSKVETVNIYPYAIRELESIKLVCDDQIDYSHKYTDRSSFQTLLEKNKEVDEVIIVQNGLITDTSFSNLAFYDGVNWFTPTTPLLKGTKRRFLLDQKMIHERDIKPQDMDQYQKFCLINAMLDLDQLTFLICRSSVSRGFFSRAKLNS